ncbi:uncharacterized protein LOC122298529 [Carya illinoinensis]|uniref:Uncharacterized protein n=1 Tax=Carya illinoinensis TaxID=32201 RepID=A0A8T1N435_CARIL|nr:uncharacterized protein LOC122298529 [Carya illinoinensis]KAG6625005.1 hypothetical protein CIPAW_16G066000 [Carya illinoinensis]KAG6625006.1 hypothetical protein CIPAW_16G066000 [Carya illinoinensis]
MNRASFFSFHFFIGIGRPRTKPRLISGVHRPSRLLSCSVSSPQPNGSNITAEDFVQPQKGPCFRQPDTEQPSVLTDSPSTTSTTMEAILAPPNRHPTTSTTPLTHHGSEPLLSLSASSPPHRELSHFISKPPCVSQTADHHPCFSTACPPRQPNTEAMHHLRKLNDSSENHPKWTEVPTAVSQAAATFLRLITNGRCHLRSTMESICFTHPKQSSSHVTRIYRDTIDICPAT